MPATKLKMCSTCGKANLGYMICPKEGSVAPFHVCDDWEEIMHKDDAQ